jgi:hypothetical protein
LVTALLLCLIRVLLQYIDEAMRLGASQEQQGVLIRRLLNHVLPRN